MKTTYLQAGAGAALLLSIGVYAATGDRVENDAMAITQASVSLAQAVAVAEGHAGGRASRAEFERTATGGWVYDVEVVAGTKVHDVKVDPKSAAVVASTEDRPDDDGHDRKD